MFSICFSRFAIPFLSASRFSFESSSFATPPLYFKALTVATSTTQSGAIPAFLHFISKNFSAPRSAPNPASVSAISTIPIATLVALTELHPCAIFAKGPPCTKASECSSVCTILGFIASFKSAAIAPTAFKSLANTGSPLKL